MARISESGTARSPLHMPPKSSSTLTTPPPPPKRPRLSLTLHPSVPSQTIKRLYEPGGFLDSQPTDSQFVDGLTHGVGVVGGTEHVSPISKKTQSEPQTQPPAYCSQPPQTSMPTAPTGPPLLHLSTAPWALSPGPATTTPPLTDEERLMVNVWDILKHNQSTRTEFEDLRRQYAIVVHELELARVLKQSLMGELEMARRMRYQQEAVLAKEHEFTNILMHTLDTHHISVPRYPH
ncbi:hypothetical protein CPB84DRAFT_1850061 [Gymnopilus junonius]|uniref:Uncharacterized protein n=1 Tax=Gymnopilus junonius TaxID=109634 RepID=A0A9P5TKA4_GYMJU|nr:hypothetical protein CPB84DRAFT_1850061 [Gymnopilus junonius]